MKTLNKEETQSRKRYVMDKNQKSLLKDKLNSLDIGEALLVKKIELRNSGYKSELKNLVNYYQRTLDKKFSIKLLNDKTSYLIERTK